MNAVGRNLKRLRQRAGLTQDALAERLHVTRQAVSSWETGKNQPDIETLTALAESLNADVRELIYGPVPVARPYARYQRKYTVCCAVCAAVVLVTSGVSGAGAGVPVGGHPRHLPDGPAGAAGGGGPAAGAVSLLCHGVDAGRGGHRPWLRPAAAVVCPYPERPPAHRPVLPGRLRSVPCPESVKEISFSHIRIRKKDETGSRAIRRGTLRGFLSESAGESGLSRRPRITGAASDLPPGSSRSSGKTGRRPR